jgi:hypothetical protein
MVNYSFFQQSLHVKLESHERASEQPTCKFECFPIRPNTFLDEDAINKMLGNTGHNCA